jgi:anti-sigma regulatory factor (Ser/Thr protein kinase)
MDGAISEQPISGVATPKVITIILPTDTYFMSGIRDFTLTMVRNMSGMSDQWAYRFQSVVDELCNNAIEHGSAPGQYITAKFLAVTGDRVEVIVEDTGTGPTHITAGELKKKIEEAKNVNANPLKNIGLRGRGLAQIVSNWTSELAFEDREGGGIRVRAVKYLKECQQAEPVKTGFMSVNHRAFAS